LLFFFPSFNIRFGDKIIKEWNIYKWIFLVCFIFTFFLLILISLNPNSTGAVVTYGLGLMGFIVFWVSVDPHLPQVQLTVTADYNPEYFWLQRFGLSLSHCLIIGLVLSSIFSLIIGSVVMSTERIVTGIPRFLQLTSGSLSTTGDFRNWVWNFATGATKETEAFNHAWIPAWIEEPLLIGLILMGTWSFFKFLITHEQFISGIIAIGITAFIFPHVWHIFAYQGMESSYWSAFTYALVDSFLIVLTGTLVGIMPHFVNNYIATYLNIVGFPLAYAIPPLFIAFMVICFKKGWLGDLNLSSTPMMMFKNGGIR
jgi:hypothetical protein